MAELSLKHIQKIYPNLEKKRKRKKGEPKFVDRKSVV